MVYVFTVMNTNIFLYDLFCFWSNCLICRIAFYCYSFRKYPLDELWLGELLGLSDYNSLRSY